MSRGGQGLDGGGDLLGQEAEALFGRVPGQPAVAHVPPEHLQTDGLLQRPDPVDAPLRGADGLGRAAGGKAAAAPPTSAVWRLRHAPSPGVPAEPGVCHSQE